MGGGGGSQWGWGQGEGRKSMVNRGGCVCGPKVGNCMPEEWESMEGEQWGERMRRAVEREHHLQGPS